MSGPTADGPDAPLTMSIDVDCPVEHAFTVWTSRIDVWWPADHTVTGRTDARVVLQPGVGGRIFERTPDGVEHDWGRVTVWEPPTRLGYRWHLHREPADATVVDIRFVGRANESTRIEIAHSGWNGRDGSVDPWRERNRAGWQTLLPHYRTAVSEGDR